MADTTEADIRDMFSTTMKTMARELDAMNKRAVELGNSGASSFDKFRRQNEALNESNKRTSNSLASMSTVLTGIGKTLIGPVGIVAGFAAFQKALEGVSESTIQLKNFSTNSGFATSNIQEMQQAMRRMGLSTQEADSSIATLGNKLNNLRAFKEGSDVFQALAKAVGGVEFANRILAFEKLGDRMGALNEITKTFNAQTREGKILLSQVFDTQINVLEDLQRAKQRGIEIWPVSLEEARKYHDYWVDFEVKFGNIWRDISNHAIQGLNDISEAFKAQGTTTRGIADWLNSQMDMTLSTIKSTIEEVKAIKAWWENPNRGLPNLGESKEDRGYQGEIGHKPPDAMGDDYARGGTLYGKFHEWMNERARRSDAGTEGTHPGITDFSGRRRDGEQIDLLRDMSDTLHRMETKDGGGGEGRTYGTGARGGSLQAGLGGFRPNTGGVNSGGARVGGTGAGGFRPRVGGVGGGNAAAAEAAGGGADAGAVAAGGGINRDKWLAQLEANPALKDELFRRSLGENTNPMANQAIMEEAANRADIRGNRGFADKGNLSYFEGNYRGTITPKMRAMLESNYNKVFREGSDVAGGAIDNSSQWLSKKHERTGRFDTIVNYGGDRITGHSGVESFQKPGTGESGRGERAAWPEFRRRQLEEAAQRRQQFDAQTSSGDKWSKGAIGAKIEFLNVPPGVRTNADVEGDIFKDLQISKTRQSGIYRQPGQAYD